MRRKGAMRDPTVRTDLTPRQREVLDLMARGATNGEIAERLGLSLDGAKWHVREIFARLGVDTREEAVAVWRQRRRAWMPMLPLAPLGVGGGLATVAGVVVLAVAAGVFGAGDSPPPAFTPAAPSTASPTATSPGRFELQVTPVVALPQPALEEVRAGDGWRMLVPDGASTLVGEPTLAIDWDRETPTVDLLDENGRIALRIETSYRPMVQFTAANGLWRLIVSDVYLADDPSGSRARILVFDLGQLILEADITLPGQRVNYILYGVGMVVSRDGNWAYWVEHGQQSDCPDGGDASICDRMSIRAVDLSVLEPVDFEAEMPRGCGWPRVRAEDPEIDVAASAVLALCFGRAERWIVDGDAGAGAFLEEVAPATSPRFATEYGRNDDYVLEGSHDNIGTITSLRLVRGSNRVVVAELRDLTIWGALLLDGSTALLLDPSGRIVRVQMLSGVGTQLPFSVEPGRQGGDVILTR